MMEKLTISGLVLLCFGIPLSAFSFFVFSNTGLTAFGLALIIIGGSMLLTPWSPVPAPPIKGMLEGSCLNIEALLEEFNAEEKAIYLPPSEGRIYSYVPLNSNSGDLDLKEIMSAARRVITDSGGNPGLFIFPPGAELVKKSGIGSEMGLEAALSFVMVDFVEIVDSVETIEEGDEIEVRFKNPQLDTEFPLYRKVLGSIPTSVAGSVMALSIGSPIRFKEEKVKEKEITARFKVVSESG